MAETPDDEGPLHALGLIEELRSLCAELWGTSSALYHHVDRILQELATPDLQDISVRLPFRVEMWDRSDQHVRWVIAASSSVAILMLRSTWQSPTIPTSVLRFAMASTSFGNSSRKRQREYRAAARCAASNGFAEFAPQTFKRMCELRNELKGLW